jgi:hypothetical protein
MGLITDDFSTPVDDRELIHGRTPPTQIDLTDWITTNGASDDLVAGLGASGIEPSYMRTHTTATCRAWVEDNTFSGSEEHGRVTFDGIPNAAGEMDVIFHTNMRLHITATQVGSDALLEAEIFNDTLGTSRYLGSILELGIDEISPVRGFVDSNRRVTGEVFYHRIQVNVEYIGGVAGTIIADLTDFPIEPGVRFGVEVDGTAVDDDNPQVFYDTLKIRTFATSPGEGPGDEDEVCLWWRSTDLYFCVEDTPNCTLSGPAQVDGDLTDDFTWVLHNLIQNVDYVLHTICQIFNDPDCEDCDVLEDPASGLVLESDICDDVADPDDWLQQLFYATTIVDIYSIAQGQFTTTGQPPVPTILQNQNSFDDADGWTAFAAVQLNEAPIATTAPTTDIFAGSWEMIWSDQNEVVGIALSATGPTGVQAHLQYGTEILTLDIAAPLSPSRILLFRAQYDPDDEILTLWERCSGETTVSFAVEDRPDSSGFQIIRPADSATSGAYNAEKLWFEHLQYCASRTAEQNDVTVAYFVTRYDLQACLNPQSRRARVNYIG